MFICLVSVFSLLKRGFVKLNTLEPTDVLNYDAMSTSFFISFSPSVVEKIIFLPIYSTWGI